MARILGLGDNVCDMYVHEKRMYPGGQALNVAVYSSMLGAQSQYMGTFGTDDVAACVKTALEELNIPFPARQMRSGNRTGYAMVRLEDGDRVFIGSNRGGVAREQPLKLSGRMLNISPDLTLCIPATTAGLTASWKSWMKFRPRFPMIFRESGMKRREETRYVRISTMRFCPAADWSRIRFARCATACFTQAHAL